MTQLEKHKFAASQVDYDPDTGVMTWAGGGLRPKGKVLGWTQSSGYLSFSVQHKRRVFHLLVHRVAFVKVNGFMPKMVDHIDGDKKNNAIGNLRPCTYETNAYNSKLPDDNKSGHKGVIFDGGRRKQKPWRAYGQKGKKFKHIGIFHTKAEAIAARKDWEMENCEGFSRKTGATA
jgi:hypothetical protein